MSHISSPIILFIISIWRCLQQILTLMGINHYTPSRSMWKTIGKNYCNDGNPIQYLCLQFFSALSGYDQYFNTSLFPILLEHLPDTIISKDLEHFYQLITTGKFTRFNYGPEANLRIYNSTVPPDYNLSKITAPVALFYSDNDYQSNATDTEHLYKELGNPVAKVLIDKISHYSFFHGRHIREMLYNKVIELMKYY
ncbi:Lipase 4 [Carabus blaptoides fortunei]